jgi:hypothetical protein
MSKHLPPVPPASVSPKGTGGDQHLTEAEVNNGPKGQNRVVNLNQQGQQENTKQNTTNQGYQQDR